MTTTETDWRAVEEKTLGYWFVAEFRANGTVARIIVYSLDEPTARLIAADHGKAALCEELADALEDLLMLDGVLNVLNSGECNHLQGLARQARAGRAPQ